jgi:hypothetical protein
MQYYELYYLGRVNLTKSTNEEQPVATLSNEMPLILLRLALCTLKLTYIESKTVPVLS